MFDQIEKLSPVGKRFVMDILSAVLWASTSFSAVGVRYSPKVVISQC